MFHCFLLGRHYGTEALKQGEISLQGIDRQRAAIIRDVATSLGVVVGLATVEHYEMGVVRDYDEVSRFVKRRRLATGAEDSDHPDSEYSDDAGFERADDTDVGSEYDYDGKPLFKEFSDMKVNTELDLIPSEPFESMKPNGHSIYDSHETGTTVTYYYHRTVVFIMPSDNTDGFLWKYGGTELALSRLRESSIPPVPRDKQWLIRILDDLGKPCYRGTKCVAPSYIEELTQHALAWNDIEIWKRVMKFWDCNLLSKIDYLVTAWEFFGFENLSMSLEVVLRRTSDAAEFSSSMKLVYSLPKHAKEEEKDMVLAWCQRLSDQLIASFSIAESKAVIICLRYISMHVFKDRILPNLLAKPDRYLFWIGVVVSLRQERSQIIERQTELINHPPLQCGSLSATGPVLVDKISTRRIVKEFLHRLIEQCFQLAASKWFIPVPDKYDPEITGGSRSTARKSALAEQVPQVNSRTVDRVTQILDETLYGEYHEISRILFVEILTSPGTSKSKFVELYKPLIKPVLDLLQKHDKDICLPPFVDFFQVLIATYLRDILGSKFESRNNYLRRIGCGCTNCGALDKFLLDPESQRHVLKVPKPKREHLEKVLASASDLCTFQTIRSGTPYGLEVTKRPNIILGSKWEQRSKDAADFLELIGSNEVIAQIMGGRYVDVEKAIVGEKVFASDEVLSEPKDSSTA